MTTTASSIRLERTIDAPIEKVDAAWTDPSLLTRWYCPNRAWEIKLEGDIAVGRDYRVHMGEHVVEGTKLVLTHTDLADAEDAKNHEEGWVNCLNRLPEVV